MDTITAITLAFCIVSLATAIYMGFTTQKILKYYNKKWHFRFWEPFLDTFEYQSMYQKTGNKFQKWIYYIFFISTFITIVLSIFFI